MTTTIVPLLCFNDVYRVKQRFVPQPGSPEDPSSSKDESGDRYITVSQFGQLVQDERAKWADRDEVRYDGEKEKDGLILFAGDVFNPSVESSVTRGSHMVPIMNALKVDISCIGNHDFDFGYPHLTRLLNATKFPWLLSNIVDENTGRQPEKFLKYWVTERCGVKIGVIGLVEQDWIATIPSWPETFHYRSMVDTAIELSKELRDPNGEHKVDIIIALTHCRVPNDINLANSLGAVANKDGVQNEHGVDLIIGGHDHMYYIGKGATSWEGHVGQRDAPGTEEDKGVRVIKSGTDFRDLSSAQLELADTPSGSVRRKVIKSLTGKHHYVLPSSPPSPMMDDMLKELLSSVEGTLQKPVCFTLTPFDARSEVVRTRETGLGNWAADVLMHAYAESLIEGGNQDFFEKEKKENGATPQVTAAGDTNEARKRKGGADAVIICGGTLRGDSQYGPGKITLGDILEVLPFEDAMVCLEVCLYLTDTDTSENTDYQIDGKGIWDTMESALSKWPAQEGRFPIVAGLRVVWDHRNPPGQRVKSIHLTSPEDDDDSDDGETAEEMIDFVEQEDGTRVEVKQKKIELGEEVKNEADGRIYRVITREYMAEGYDGFQALKNRKFIIDDETGQIMSSIIRSFLLGSLYIFRHQQLRDAHQTHLSKRTDRVLAHARARTQSGESQSPLSSAASSPKSSKLLFSPVHERDETSIDHNVGEMSPGEVNSPSVRRTHVVSHNWKNIRNAMLIAKSEHMSSVDDFQGHEIRHSHDNPQERKQPKPKSSNVGPMLVPVENNKRGDAAASFFVDEKRKDELKSLADDLAIVCPLVDGRMRDLGVEE